MKKQKLLFIKNTRVKIICLIITALFLMGCTLSNPNQSKKNTINKENACLATPIKDHSITLGGEVNPNITIVTEYHEDISEETRNIVIEYPTVLGLDDTISNDVNEMIKKEALSIYEDEIIMQNEKIDFKIDYEWYANKDILSVKYQGIGVYVGKPLRYVSTVNIDLKTGNRIKLSDFYKTDKDTIKCLYDHGDKEEVDEKIHYGKEQFSEYVNKEILSKLQEIDTANYIDVRELTIYSYFQKDYVVIITVHGITALGGYNQMIIPYEEIEQFRKN